MERKAMDDLIAWKDSPDRKPLIVRGLRQTGKTWLVTEFGRRHYASMVTVDLNDRSLHDAFAAVTEPETILSLLSLMLRTPIDEGTLVFLDEVQECPDALLSLKYFRERAPSYHVIAAGSLLGVSFGQGRGFPVGKVSEITLRPMDFTEFLAATGNERAAEAVESYDAGTLTRASSAMAGLLKEYMCVGGMPEAVRTYAETGDLLRVRDVQNALVSQFESDLSNHPPGRMVQRIREIWSSVPGQLSKESGGKFVYSLMGKGGAARYMEAIQWLAGYGLVTMVGRAERPSCPLSSVSDGKSFKLFAADVGLLGAKAGLDPSVIVHGDRLFTEFRGSLTEQYVLQELVCAGYSPYYWSSEKNEVDFLVEHGGTPVPVEVRSSVNLKSKSLRAFRDRYGLTLCVRTSLAGVRDEGWLVNIPLYAIGSIGKALDGRPGDGRPRTT